jgi:ferredoxin-NADP reductase
LDLESRRRKYTLSVVRRFRRSFQLAVRRAPGARREGGGVMRVISKSRKHFHGTHKGGEINIEREPDGRFYIQVRWPDGGYIYDGWAPDSVRTMTAAKREAKRGACLDEEPRHD